MVRTWVLAANSSRAYIYSTERATGDLKQVEEFDCPEARLHEQELTSDLPGRAFDSGGEGRHAMVQAVEPKRQGAINFAIRITDYLESARNDRKFRKLYIIAAPTFLGLLRGRFSAALADMVRQEIDKNLVNLRVQDIRNYLPERF